MNALTYLLSNHCKVATCLLKCECIYYDGSPLIHKRCTIHEENIQNPWTEIENKTPRKPRKPFEKKLLGLLTQERRKTPNMMIVILSDNPVQ